MIVLKIRLCAMDRHNTVGQLANEESKIPLHWTHWFFGTYTTRYLYMRGVMVTFDVNYYIVYRWKKDEER